MSAFSREKKHENPFNQARPKANDRPNWMEQYKSYPMKRQIYITVTRKYISESNLQAFHQWLCLLASLCRPLLKVCR